MLLMCRRRPLGRNLKPKEARPIQSENPTTHPHKTKRIDEEVKAEREAILARERERVEGEVAARRSAAEAAAVQEKEEEERRRREAEEKARCVCGWVGWSMRVVCVDGGERIVDSSSSSSPGVMQ